MSPRILTAVLVLGASTACGECNLGDDDVDDAYVGAVIETIADLAAEPVVTEPVSTSTCASDGAYRLSGRDGTDYTTLPSAHWEEWGTPDLGDDCYAANVSCTVGVTFSQSIAGITACSSGLSTEQAVGLANLAANIQGEAEPIVLGECGACDTLLNREFVSEEFTYGDHSYVLTRSFSSRDATQTAYLNGSSSSGASRRLAMTCDDATTASFAAHDSVGLPADTCWPNAGLDWREGFTCTFDDGPTVAWTPEYEG